MNLGVLSVADPDIFLKKAKEAVVETDDALSVEEIYIVWFAKVLGNWKALISTDRYNGYYWEVTYNGNKKETYVDTYVKEFNDVIPD